MMIDWLGARKPIEIVLMMTIVVALAAAAIDRVIVPFLTR
jgi:preprotein translocase subunit SecE